MAEKTRILIVDDDPAIPETAIAYLDPERYDCDVCADGAGVVERIQSHHPDCILLDVNLPHLSGLDILKQIRENGDGVPVVMVSGHVSTGNAIDAMKDGAYEYVTKPFRMEALEAVITRAVERKDQGTTETASRHDVARAGQIIGKSPEIVEIAKLIGQTAGTEASVLILGESGTGKELVARAIHRNSARSDHPFHSVNCAAIPETLLESELFGHEKGAFTGALSRKLGRFEQSDGGTIFLDEVADMTPLTQSKILRVLQEQRFERVGGDQTVQVDVRVIAATNKSLADCIKTGAFRADLYYRLKVVSIALPPLRERKGDIPLLAAHFINKYAAISRRPAKSLHKETLARMLHYPWPGNVRELENAIHTALVLSREAELLPEDFPVFQDDRELLQLDVERISRDYHRLFTTMIAPIFRKIAANCEGRIYAEMNDALEHALVQSALEETGSNQVRAAQLLGISRNTLRDRMKRHGLK